jgi:hypothetical protein
MTQDADVDLHAMQTAQEYLKLSRIYADYLGGLRWATTEDALVHVDGRLFAFNEAIATFVDGFASQGRAIPFGYLLHWMDLLLNQRQLRVPAIHQLRMIFLQTSGNWRNAGAFAATMSDEAPETPALPDLELVSARLRNRAFPIRWYTAQFREATFPGEAPPLEPGTFEHMVIVKLAAYSEDDLRAWLQTGRGPIRHARRLVEELPLPRSLAGLLTSLLDRPRLAGAQTYVAQLIGALALPPRRFVPQELPVGGYSDIVTRGQVEHLLPAQFALDEMEFLRRFTENELLYFRREEPPAQHRQEMVVLLDQGVRTWGDVRLVLTAAALAYGKHAALRKTPLRFAATSNDGRVVDPLTYDGDAMGELLEASDLSLNPGLALEQVLETPAEALRDVVLLTHPRSLRESDVLDAARRLGANDRLFAVALDAHGQVEISEVRHGAPIKLRQFHVDFAPSLPKPRPKVARDGIPGTMWTGDVEAIPYPFRLGTEPHLTHFDFDYDGRWLLTVSGQGTLHLWRLDGFAQEMLPRPFFKQVLKKVIGVIGVLGGFVVAARVESSLIFAHYDIIRRHCKSHEFSPYVKDEVYLYYDRERHTLMTLNPMGWPLHAIDLREKKPQVGPVLDANAAASARPPKLLPFNRWLPIVRYSDPRPVDSLRTHSMRYPTQAEHDESAGELTVHQSNGTAVQSHVLAPIMDGKRCLSGAMLLSAQYAGSSIALHVRRRDIGESITLLSCPDGAVIREYPIVRAKHKIRRHLLSFDGSRIALERSDHRIEVNSIYEGGGASFCTRVGGFTHGAQFFAGRHCVVLKLGAGRHYWHLFFWGDGKLIHRFERATIRAHQRLDFNKFMSFAPHIGDATLKTSVPSVVPPVCADDRERFLSGACTTQLDFVLDRFGQVTVLDRNGNVLAMFIAFREHWAAWMPDGIRLGSASLSNGPETPGAAERIGRTLLDAEMEDYP